MLDSISHLPSWKKVNTGMMRLYEGNLVFCKASSVEVSLGLLFKGGHVFMSKMNG